MITKINNNGLAALESGEIDILLLQVNCYGIIDSEIFNSVCEKYPEVKQNYIYFCRGENVFENNVLVEIGNKKYVCLMFTSYYNSPPNNKYFPNIKTIDTFKTRLSALKKAIKKLLTTHSHLNIGLDVNDIENKKLPSAQNLTNEEYYDIFILHHLEKIMKTNFFVFI